MPNIESPIATCDDPMWSNHALLHGEHKDVLALDLQSINHKAQETRFDSCPQNLGHPQNFRIDIVRHDANEAVGAAFLFCDAEDDCASISVRHGTNVSREFLAVSRNISLEFKPR